MKTSGAWIVGLVGLTVMMLTGCSAATSGGGEDEAAPIDAQSVTSSSTCADLTALSATDAEQVVNRIGEDIGLRLEADSITSYCGENPSAQIDEAARAVAGIDPEEPDTSSGTACSDYETALGASTMNSISRTDVSSVGAPFTDALPTLPDCTFAVAAGAETQYYLLWNDADFSAVHSALVSSGLVEVSAWDSPDGTEHAYALGGPDAMGYFPLSGGERVAPGMPDRAVLFVWAA